MRTFHLADTLEQPKIESVEEGLGVPVRLQRYLSRELPDIGIVIRAQIVNQRTAKRLAILERYVTLGIPQKVVEGIIPERFDLKACAYAELIGELIKPNL